MYPYVRPVYIQKFFMKEMRAPVIIEDQFSKIYQLIFVL